MGLPSQQECVFVLVTEDCGLAFLFTREDSSLCPPAAVKTVLENQSFHLELTLEKSTTRANRPS